MTNNDFDLSEGEEATLKSFSISDAIKDNTLPLIASTYDVNDNMMRVGSEMPGPKFITFAGILDYDMYPLAGILKELLAIAQKGMGSPVEIEFAVREGDDGDLEFNVLQIRPLVTLKEHQNVRIHEDDRPKSFIYTEKALGNVCIESIKDIVMVPPSRFNAANTVQIASEIGMINKELEGKDYLLIGLGRWGTSDPWLGIPVTWDQISEAKAIVEASLEGFQIDPSHGTHFFHNITSLGLAYMTIPYGTDQATIDWEWLEGLPCKECGEFVRHIRFDEEITIKIDGRRGQGIAIKPGLLKMCDVDVEPVEDE